MKHVLFLLIAAGITMSTACSTNETMSESGQDSSSAADTATATPAKTTEATSQTPAETAVEKPEPVTESTEPETPATTTSSSDGSSITYVCTHGSSERIIRVIYYDEGPIACEVTYEKSTGTQSLWSAISDEAYCEDRAAEFVVKQQGWGWDCNKQ